MVANTAVTFVRLAPLIAGSVAGNLPSGIVPELNCDAFNEVRLTPLAVGSVAGNLASGTTPEDKLLALRAVKLLPLPTKPLAVTIPTALIPAPTTIPDLAVITPIESTFVTSSYVRVPAIDTLPSNCELPTKVDNPVTLR